MAVKVFLTGVTGYIGGTAFDYIYNAHPDNEYVILVRDEARGAPIKAKYPNVSFVFGDLEAVDVIEKAASEADVVIDTADSADNVPAATAIAKGLEAGHTAVKPGYWIHLSGTGILTWWDSSNGREGEAPLDHQKYYDIDSVDKITSFREDVFHRDVDMIVQGSNSDAVRAAIICPCTIYGVGTGPVKNRSMQVPDMAHILLRDGKAPIVGAGETEWDNVHIKDLGDLYLRLFNASQDPEKQANPEIFGRKAYFFASNGVHKWSDVARQIVEEAKKQGVRPDAETQQVTLEDLKTLKSANLTWAHNSKGVPQRANKYLGWVPKEESLESTIPALVKSEAEALGVSPK